jgi:hypothetical protein
VLVSRIPAAAEGSAYGSDKNVHVFGIRLHARHGLDARSTAADHSHPVILPLFFFIVIGPGGCVDNLEVDA